MVELNLKDVFNVLPQAFAYHQTIYDENDKAIDYVFIDVNPAFETMTGLRRETVVGRKVLDVLPGLDNSNFDWFAAYDQVSEAGQSKSFKQFSAELGKWYDVVAFSDKTDCFGTIFWEITRDVSEKEALEQIVEVSCHCLKRFGESFVLEKIAEAARKISGARYAGFNIYDDNGSVFRTVDLAGLSGQMNQMISLLGFDPINKIWNRDESIAERIRNQTIIQFDSLFQFTGNSLPYGVASLLASLFNVGTIYVARIVNEDRMLGDFTLMMSLGGSISHDEHFKLMCDLTGQYLERVRAHEGHLASKKELEEFFNVNLELLCIADVNGRFIRLNRAWTELLGYSEEELKAKKFFDLIHPDDLPLTFENVSKLKNQQIVLNFINRYQAKDGSFHYLKWRLNPGGELIYAAAKDITQRVLLEEKSFIEQVKFKATLLSVSDGIIATDNQCRITVMNKIAEYLTEWPQEEAIGLPLTEVMQIVNEYTLASAVNPADEVLLTGKIINLENNTALITKSGRIIPIEVSAAPIIGQSGNITGVVIVSRDFTEKREKQREVEYLSIHDHLTGLYNRRFLEKMLKRMDTARNLPFAIFVIDVNGLKLTNDAYGHEMGDELLKTVARVLRNNCRREDIIARTGGDEFVIIYPHTGAEQAETICHSILTQAGLEKLDSIIISLAVGFAIKSVQSQGIWEIMKQADNRMYKNKIKHGKFMRSQTIETVLRNINSKYDKEQIHTERVSQYCEAMAKAMGFTQNQLEEIRTVGALHDIGKITVPPEILNKQDRLTEQEWDEIKRHTVTGYNILKSVEEYASLAEVVLHHHERWDGKGYPSGLRDRKSVV